MRKEDAAAASQKEMDLSLVLMGKIMLAALLGAVLGIERDLQGRPAGLRTNLIIAVGACLFGILSSEGYSEAGGTQDPTRIASIVVQGIGFIAAGVLLKGEQTVLGLTTASTIWLTAAIGLAVGAGLFELAAFVTVFCTACLLLLAPVSAALEKFGNARMQRKGRTVVREG